MSDTTASLRRKINSAGDLQSVVRTMKALAASSISQYEQSVRALGDCWMEFTVRNPVDDKQRRTTRDRLFTRLLEEIDKTEGRVALVSAAFHLVEPPVFDVRLTRGSPPAPAPTAAKP